MRITTRDRKRTVCTGCLRDATAPELPEDGGCLECELSTIHPEVLKIVHAKYHGGS